MYKFIPFKGPRLKYKYMRDVFTNLQHLPSTAGIYLITEKKLNLRYVGSSQNVFERALSYMYPCQPNYMKCLFIDLDTRHMKIELLEDCSDMDMSQVRDREAFWIRQLDTFYPKGLNRNTPSKGSGAIRNEPYLQKQAEILAKGACYQLFHFAKRMDFFLEMANSTPENPNWNPQRFMRKLKVA